MPGTLVPFPSNTAAVVPANRLPRSGMIRANLIKSFHAAAGGREGHTSLCVSDAARGTRRERERDDVSPPLEMKHGGRKEGRKKGPRIHRREGRPPSVPPVRWLNFARIPRTKIAIRAGATSEFFMPASRGEGKKEAVTRLQPCIFYVHSIFAFHPSLHPCLVLLLDVSSTSFLPSTAIRYPLLWFYFLSPFRIHFSGVAARSCRPSAVFLASAKLGHRRQRKFNLERPGAERNGGEPARGR